MTKIFSIVLFVTVLACNPVFAADEATEGAELKKTEVNVEVVTSDVVVEEVQ